MPETLKKILVSILIGGLCVSAFFIRFHNFKKPGPRTVDEVVYYVMARQMDDNIFAYNAAGYALNARITQGKQLPDYFYDPLFKHPPSFILMLYLSLKVFGPTPLGAGFVPAALGALSIALIYLLGRLIGGRAVGILAAGFMFIDPVGIMSSQKVWMDTPLMFFMLLTVYAYWKAIRDKNDHMFFLGGLAAGISVMIKYPGILTFLCVLLFVLLCAPEFFKNKKFLISLTFPVLLSLPWILMNYYVYGADFIHKRLVVHGGFNNPLSIPFLFFDALCLGILLSFWFVVKNPTEISARFQRLFASRFVYYLKFFGFIGAAVFVLFHLPKSLDFYEVPAAVWFQGAFSGQPRWFYFQRLLKFCVLYGFAYLAFFDIFFKSDEGRFLMKINAFLIIVFFVAWGNFQCRYILPALPFLMILSADYIWRLLGGLARINWISLRILLQAVVLILVVLAVSKTMLINYAVSFTNDMCYF